MVGVRQQWRCGRIPTRLCVGRITKMRASGHKIGQRHDVRAQRHDVPAQRRDVQA